MFGRKQTGDADLTTPEAVAAGQEVYDRLPAIRTEDVHAELDKAHGKDK